MQFCLALLVTMSAAPADPLKPGDTTRTLSVGGRERYYIVHVPAKHDLKKPAPIVLVFHGGGSNPRQMIEFCGLNATADREDFITAYPAGTGRLPAALTWNAGNCCGYAQRQNVDDVAFTAAVLDDLAKVAAVDPKRVYATGMSNGGLFSYLLASNLSTRIAAIAPVSGPMGTEKCSPTRPVSVLHFHGTEDKFAPLAGGVGEKSLTRTQFYSVDHSIQAWVRADGCREKPEESVLQPRAPGGMKVTRRTYGGGRDGSEVVLYIIHGGGHTWPGRQPKVNFLGPATLDISANDLMWQFFKKHPLK